MRTLPRCTACMPGTDTQVRSVLMGAQDNNTNAKHNKFKKATIKHAYQYVLGPPLPLPVPLPPLTSFPPVPILPFLHTNRYRFFGDPITSQQEAMRSLQMKDSLYPTLRHVPPVAPPVPPVPPLSRREPLSALRVVLGHGRNTTCLNSGSASHVLRDISLHLYFLTINFAFHPSGQAVFKGAFFSPPPRYAIRSSSLFRGTIVNRTYGTHLSLYIYLFLLTLCGPIYYGLPSLEKNFLHHPQRWKKYTTVASTTLGHREPLPNHS